MKKVIVIGIAVLMVMGMATMAMASESAWTLLIKAGNGSTLTGAQGATQIGIAAAASTGTYASLTSTQAGIYGIDPDPAKMANKDIRVAGQTEYTWNLKVQTGTSWTAPVSIGWNFPSSVLNAGPKWTFKVFRAGNQVALFTDKGSAYSGATFNILPDTYAVGTGASEDWKIVASSVPEPGSIVAMLSGLVGLAGFGIRRRK